MSNFTETPIASDVQKEFDFCMANGLKNLGVKPDDDADVIVKAVGDFIYKWDADRKSFFRRLMQLRGDTANIALWLGIVWGNQVCRAFGWTWACLECGGHTYYGVVSSDRAYVVHPTDNILNLLNDPGRDNATILFYNMMKAGKSPPSAPGMYNIGAEW